MYRFRLISAPLVALGAGIVCGAAVTLVTHWSGAAVPSWVAVAGLVLTTMLITFGAGQLVTPYRFRRRIAAREAHLRALVTGARDVTMVLDAQLRVRWQSPAAAAQFGLTDWQVLGQSFLELSHPDDRAVVGDRLRTVAGAPPGTAAPTLFEARLADGHGRWRDVESSVSDLRAVPEVGGLVLQVRDVAHRRALERTIHQLASQDQLTGLAHRRELLRAIAARRAGGASPAGVLLVLDLDGFCEINDLRGRSAGDAVLSAAADRIRQLAGADELVCRLGERQFALLTILGPVDAYALGFRLLSEVGRPYRLPDGAHARVSPSIGLTDVADADRPEDVVRRADLARRRAGQLGSGRIDWYDQALEHDRVRRMDLERYLFGAAGRGEFDVVYQPIVALADRRPVGVEATMRWHHPGLGVVSAPELLPVAKRLGLSAEVGEWFLYTACAQAAQWRREGHDLWLALNFSADQLMGARFVGDLIGAVRVHQLPPERLVIEVAEHELDADPAALASRLGRLRGYGVRIALDQVGGARSDPARWRRLPLDQVKLGSPATGVDHDGFATEVVAEVAGRLQLPVVADGVVTAPAWEDARRAGCRYGQGELIAPPVPAERMEAYLATFVPQP